MQLSENLSVLLGRLHPVLVHMPIGGLVLLALLELVSSRPAWRNVAQNNRWILGFISVMAVLASGCGWLLAQSGGYDDQLLLWHRGLGVTLAAGCILTFTLLHRRRLLAYRISLALTVVLLAVVSQLGGSITHGPDFFTRRLSASAPARLFDRPVFGAVIEPILQHHCIACHGAERHKADLRLDDIEGLLRGGLAGPVIKAGLANDSLLIQRMLLPLEADGRMPPEDQSQPTAPEIALIRWWIDSGAPISKKISDLKPNPEIALLMQVVSARVR